MASVLGVNPAFHDPAAALVIDAQIVAVAEAERFTRRKHGKAPVAFSTWELPTEAARWCLATAGLAPAALGAVASCSDPGHVRERGPFGATIAGQGVDAICSYEFEPLRTLDARRAPRSSPTRRLVSNPHACASSRTTSPARRDGAVLVVDGRGEDGSHLAVTVRAGEIEVRAAQRLPHSLGLFYEEATAHLGFQRASDEYTVRALASHGEPRPLDALRQLVRTDGAGGFVVQAIDWERLGPALRAGAPWSVAHADLAASVQARLEEVHVELARWLRAVSGEEALTMAGGVALNCVANARLAAESGFARVWVQPAEGDAGTALGAALLSAHALGDRIAPLTSAALGRGFSDEEIEAALVSARLEHERVRDVAESAADVLANDDMVAWFQGRSEYGPRALGHCRLLAHPGRAGNLARLNAVKGREQFRPVAPMVLAERASEIFDRQLPSPSMLFTHRVRLHWRDREPAVIHVDGSARVQTVAGEDEPLLHAMLERFARRSELPLVVNTSVKTAGRAMVDSPRDALERFGSTPIELLMIGPFALRRTKSASRRL